MSVSFGPEFPFINIVADNAFQHPLRTAKEEKIATIKNRFILSKVRIVEELEREDRQLFLGLWKTNGIFGFAFAGHGMDNGDGDYSKGGGVCTTNNKSDMPIAPTDVTPPYKLAFIAAFSCGATDIGWGKTGGAYPLSTFGKYIGYWGEFDIFDDSKTLNSIQNGLMDFLDYYSSVGFVRDDVYNPNR